MIILIAISIIWGLAYYELLSRYGKLWEDIEEHESLNLQQSVTLIIPFRNEENNLPKLINSLNQLSLSKITLDILFVDDHSSDQSAEYILNSNLKHANKLLSLTEAKGKKEALKLAWGQAQGDIIVQTDSDCILPQNWLQSMLGFFEDEEIRMVSGPVKFFNRKELAHQIVQLDFAALIAIGAAHIQWNSPLICNGANLAYRKSSLIDLNLRENKASGDDVFLMQSISRSYPEGIAFCRSEEAIVETAGPRTFKEFWNQRLRWASKNGEYDLKKNTLILAGVWLFNLTIVLAFLSFSSVGLTIAAFLVLMKLLAEDKFYSKFAVFFGLEGWIKRLLIGQPFHILYMTLLPPLSQVLSFKWKERKVK
jgi:cellulose synthase/poly-beta-1,6-N-acetylglucosamine synthase-like glycosyltransferase